jgi:GH25 family lysozyme M1 (1,4-beta-N-acetylmuramidase)/uncharacterized protein YraI
MVDFDKMVAAGMKFIIIKASQQTADPDFVENWKRSRAAGLIRGAYHYLDWRKSEMEQAKLFVDLLRADPGELPPSCDFEMDLNNPGRAVASGKLHNFLTYVEQELGVVPMIYCGPYFWMDYGGSNKEWARYALWLAHYRPIAYGKPAGPIVPLPWKTYTFWQYDDLGDGLRLGAESKELDVNVFNGDEAAFEAFVKSVRSGSGYQTPETPAEPKPEEPKGLAYVVDIPGLNVRSGPSTNSSVVKVIRYGAPVSVLETKGDWARIGAGMWVYKPYLKAALPSYAPIYEVNVGGLNVRKGPGTNYAIVKVIYKGTRVEILEINGEWACISPGQWVYMPYLRQV